MGQGDMEPAPTIPFPSPGITDALNSHGSLRVPGALRLPLRRLAGGDRLSVADHNPGTFFLYHKETLEGMPFSPEEIEAYAGRALPEAPPVPSAATSNMAKLPLGYYETGEVDGRRYTSMIYGGMVQEVGRINRRRALIGFPLLGGFRSSEPQDLDSPGSTSMVFYTGPLQIEPDPVAIGEPVHFLKSVLGGETIQRINFMELHIDAAADDEAAGQLEIEHSPGMVLA